MPTVMFVPLAAVLALLGQAGLPAEGGALWGIVMTHYGPTAFGLLAVLLIWDRIVRPAMRDSRADNKVMVDALSAVSSNISTASAAVSAAATELHGAIEAQKDSHRLALQLVERIERLAREK